MLSWIGTQQSAGKLFLHQSSVLQTQILGRVRSYILETMLPLFQSQPWTWQMEKQDVCLWSSLLLLRKMTRDFVSHSHNKMARDDRSRSRIGRSTLLFAKYSSTVRHFPRDCSSKSEFSPLQTRICLQSTKAFEMKVQLIVFDEIRSYNHPSLIRSHSGGTGTTSGGPASKTAVMNISAGCFDGTQKRWLDELTPLMPSHNTKVQTRQAPILGLATTPIGWRSGLFNQHKCICNFLMQSSTLFQIDCWTWYWIFTFSPSAYRREATIGGCPYKKLLDVD
jgi:hypothetical protein